MDDPKEEDQECLNTEQTEPESNPVNPSYDDNENHEPDGAENYAQDGSLNSKESEEVGSMASKDSANVDTVGDTDVMVVKQHKKGKRKSKHKKRQKNILEHIYENTVDDETKKYNELNSDIRVLEELREHLSPIPAQPGKQDLRELALDMALKDTTGNTGHTTCKFNKQIDYVLVYNHGEAGELFVKEREKFLKKIDDEGFEVHNIESTGRTFILLHCSFERLAQEAEQVSLKMPLLGLAQPVSLTCNTAFWNSFRTEYPVDYISAPFCRTKLEIYLGHEDINTFFRPALRSLLVNHILKNLDIREEIKRNRSSNHGLGYMMMIGAFSDAFSVHEKSSVDSLNPVPANQIDFLPNCNADTDDPRRDLAGTWLKSSKFQPLWQIRNYFGEKIALYFSWLGLMVTTLWIPMILGLCVFIYGFIVAVNENKDSIESVNVLTRKWFARAFDNDATPFFAFVICLWGTIFLEMWKRKNSQLAYEWDVDDFEEQEPNRPEFYGTKTKVDPVSGEETVYYPFKNQLLRMMGSCNFLLMLVVLVIGATFAIIVYRVFARVDFFSDNGAVGPLLASTTSSLLNTVVIMIMGKLYQSVAVRLTDWENHRTQTGYEDALIIKLFAFQFVNSYASLFYIAFFRERTSKSGILGKGPTYSDGCGDDNDCMTLLSIQVAMLMIVKPLPKLFTDLVVPWMKKLWRKMRKCMCGDNKVAELEGGESHVHLEDFLEREMQKEPLKGEFTLSEYNEKVIQYGFLMLFTAAFPLAPLIAIVTNLFDMRIDARRLLFWTRRPVALRAEDIGMWFTILQFLNMIGVVTNAFLITFTSRFGRAWGSSSTSTGNSTMTGTPSITSQIDESSWFSDHLWLLIIFEHAVFSFKFVLAWMIPDTPGQVRQAQRREKYHVSQTFSREGMHKGPGNIITPAAQTLYSVAQPAAANSAGHHSAETPPSHPEGGHEEEAKPKRDALPHRSSPKPRKVRYEESPWEPIEMTRQRTSPLPMRRSKLPPIHREHTDLV